MGDLGQVKLWCDTELMNLPVVVKCYVEIPDKQIWRREITDVNWLIDALMNAASGFTSAAGATSIAAVYPIICATTGFGCLRS